MKRFFYGIMVIWAIIACVCLAAPEPAIVQAPGQWTLDMEFTHPQQVILGRGPDKKPVTYWYTIITITNNTGDDVDFYPKCVNNYIIYIYIFVLGDFNGKIHL